MGKLVQLRWMMIALVAALIGLTSCSDDATLGEQMFVNGEVNYSDSATADQSATPLTLTVTVSDTARADAAAEVLGQQSIEPAVDQSPVPFSVEVSAEDLTAAISPTVRATVTDAEGSLIWTTDTVHPVTLPESGDQAQAGSLMLVATPSSASGSGSGQGGDDGEIVSPVLGEWPVTDVNGAPAVEGRAPMIRFGSDGKVAGSTGCNNFNGTYRLDGENLVVEEPLATTRRACIPELGDQESEFLAVLTTAQTFEVIGSEAMLIITGADGATLTARR